MSEQLVLDYQAYARNTDPATSLMAAQAVTPKLPELERKVLEALKANPEGLTLDELTYATGLEKVTASPRLRPLCDKGLVIETDERRPGRSGRPQTVWKAA